MQAEKLMSLLSEGMCVGKHVDTTEQRPQTKNVCFLGKNQPSISLFENQSSLLLTWYVGLWGSICSTHVVGIKEGHHAHITATT